MTPRCYVVVCILSLALIGTSCSLFGETDEPDSLAGSWRGPVTTEDSTYVLTLALEQPPNASLTGSSVSGSGRLAASDTSWSFEVHGTVTEPDLSMELRFETARPAQLQGEVDEALQTIDAELFGGPLSFDAVPVTLDRQ